jgi:hypothetical protein
MGTGKSLLPRSLRRKTSWGELTLDEKEEVATYLVVGAYYPPPPASSRKRSAKATTKKNKGRRKKAVRVLLIEERAQRFDQAISALAAGKGSNDCKVLHELIEPVVQLWDEGLVEGLARQPSLRFYNELRSREIWSELANSYLIAVALIRQRLEHARSSRVKDAGLRRAIWLVESTYPPKCDYAYPPSMKRFAGWLTPLRMGCAHRLSFRLWKPLRRERLYSNSRRVLLRQPLFACSLLLPNFIGSVLLICMSRSPTRRYDRTRQR